MRKYKYYVELNNCSLRKNTKVLVSKAFFLNLKLLLESLCFDKVVDMPYLLFYDYNDYCISLYAVEAVK